MTSSHVEGPRTRTLCETDAAKSKPSDLYGVSIGIDWFPAVLAGDEQLQSDMCWKISGDIINLINADGATTGSRIHVSDEELAAAKVFAFGIFRIAGDGLYNTPGFSIDALGVDGELFVEVFNAYTYEDHHAMLCNVASCDFYFMGSEPFWLLLQYGRVKDSVAILERMTTVNVQKLVKDPLAMGYRYTLLFASCMMSTVIFMHGSMGDHFAKSLWHSLGLTFENAEEWMLDIAEDGAYTKVDFMWEEGDTPGAKGLMNPKRMVWQLKCVMILCSRDQSFVSDAAAIRFLRTLPEDDAEFFALSLCMGDWDHPSVFGLIEAVWIALACEKVGLDDAAIRFADFQLGPLKRCGNPNRKYSSVMALHCKGRVLAKLNRPEESLAAFQRAVAVSQASFPMMQAFAYRELERCTAAPEAVAAKARADLDAELRAFQGRLTRAEFDSLYVQFN